MQSTEPSQDWRNKLEQVELSMAELQELLARKRKLPRQVTITGVSVRGEAVRLFFRQGAGKPTRRRVR